MCMYKLTNSHDQQNLSIPDGKEISCDCKYHWPQCETSLTHDAVPVTETLKIDSLQHDGTLWHPLRYGGRWKVSFKMSLPRVGCLIFSPESLFSENCGGDLQSGQWHCWRLRINLSNCCGQAQDRIFVFLLPSFLNWLFKYLG